MKNVAFDEGDVGIGEALVVVLAQTHGSPRLARPQGG